MVVDELEDHALTAADQDVLGRIQLPACVRRRVDEPAVRGPRLLPRLFPRDARLAERAESRATALAEASPSDLLAAAAILEAEEQEADTGAPIYAVSIDGDTVPLDLVSAFREGVAAPVPLVIGSNDDEGALFELIARMGSGETIPVTPETMQRRLGSSPGFAGVVAAYGGLSGETASRMGGDREFWIPSLQAADAHAAIAATRVYRFDYVSADPRFGAIGATHGQEIQYVFGTTRATLLGEGDRDGLSRDAQFSAALMDLWLDTARGEWLAIWPQYNAAERKTLILDDPLRVESDPRGERREAWAAFADDVPRAQARSVPRARP